MDAQRGIARRTVIGLPADGLTPGWERDFSNYPPAGVIIFARDFADLEGLRHLTTRLRELARPRRLFLAIDEEGGTVSQLGRHLVVPPNALLLGRGAETGDIEWASQQTGRRLRSLGIDWVLAPVADVHSEPLNPVIGPRAFGTESAVVTERVAEAVQGFRAAGIASCLKHFPGHGDTMIDSHLALPTSPHDRGVLEQRELPPFASNLDADTVMTAHVVYPAWDSAQPATFSHAIVHELLRERLGFQGLCITDALEMKGASEGRSPFEVARSALEAGVDLLLFAHHDDDVRRVRLELARALVDGGIDRQSFEEGRGRLARLDHERPEPTPAELERPLDSLTPPDWEPRLERIIDRGLIVRGSLQGVAGPWQIEEPEFAVGPPLRSELSGHSLPLTTDGAAAAQILCIANRRPLPDQEIERLRARSRERPTVLVGLQNDAFLDRLPEAALTLSAADSTPLTRRVVARRLVSELRAAALRS